MILHCLWHALAICLPYYFRIGTIKVIFRSSSRPSFFLAVEHLGQDMRYTTSLRKVPSAISTIHSTRSVQINSANSALCVLSLLVEEQCGGHGTLELACFYQF